MTVVRNFHDYAVKLHKSREYENGIGVGIDEDYSSLRVYII